MLISDDARRPPASLDIGILKDGFFKNLSKKSILAAQIFGFRGDKFVTKKISCLSRTRLAHWSLSMPLPNIIKIF